MENRPQHEIVTRFAGERKNQSKARKEIWAKFEEEEVGRRGGYT